MPSSFSQALWQLFLPKTLFPFLLGSLGLSVLGNAAFALLTTVFGSGFGSLVVIVVVALLVLLAGVFVFWLNLRRLADALPLPGKVTPAKHKGLILLISRTETARHAIAYHLPVLSDCWLVYSQKTLSLAEELREEFSQVTCHLLAVNDVNDPLEFVELVRGVYRRLPATLKSGDVIADYTGMTAHGSVGMVLACVGRDRPLQFTPAEYDANQRPIRPLDPIQIDLGSTIARPRPVTASSVP